MRGKGRGGLRKSNPRSDAKERHLITPLVRTFPQSPTKPSFGASGPHAGVDYEKGRRPLIRPPADKPYGTLGKIHIVMPVAVTRSTITCIWHVDHQCVLEEHCSNTWNCVAVPSWVNSQALGTNWRLSSARDSR